MTEHIPPCPDPQPESKPLPPEPDMPPELDMPSGPLTPGRTLEVLLKNPARLFDAVRQGERLKVTGFLFVMTTLCLLAYGVLVGLFSGQAQLWAAPLKITGGVLFSGLICLPSLYIFSCLSGMDRGIGEVTAMLLVMLCLASLLLIGFAPVAWVFSMSTESVGFMGFLHIAFWLVGVFFGIRLLLLGCAHFNVQDQRYLHLWVPVFMIVSLQMTATLRPILGTSESFFPTEKRFFLQHWSDVLFETQESNRDPSGTPAWR